MILSDRTVTLSWAVGVATRTYVLLTTGDPKSALAATTSAPSTPALFTVLDLSGGSRSGIQLELTKTSGSGTWPAAWATSTKIQAFSGITIGAAKSPVFANDQGTGHPGPYMTAGTATAATHDLGLTNAQFLPQTVNATAAIFVEFFSFANQSTSPPVVAYLLSFTPSTNAPTDTHSFQLRLMEWAQ